VFKIVNATIDDIPLIRELTFQVWPQTYAEVITKEQISYMLDMMYSETSLKRQMTEEHCRFLFIYEDEKPAGFASYSEIEPGTFKLHKIYILPGGQGKGKGRFMIDHILNEIKTKMGKALQLQVNRENKARWFYEKLGFSIIREIDLDIGNGFFMRDYIMEKKL
jgi:ribosomal protein S18 acetylase RimI-like enzyme